MKSESQISVWLLSTPKMKLYFISAARLAMWRQKYSGDRVILIMQTSLV